MHRAIAAWLTERPWRAALSAAICGAFAPQMPMPFMVLAGAIPVLMALRFDPKHGLIMAATAAASAAWLLLSLAPQMPWLAVGVVGVMVAPVLLALLLKRTGSLNLCFQLAVAGVTVVIIAVYATVSDPSAAVRYQPHCSPMGTYDVGRTCCSFARDDAGIVVSGMLVANAAAGARTIRR
jgi:hypothetical protein